MLQTTRTRPVFVVLFVCITLSAQQPNQCSIQNGQCTYNILLSTSENGCSDTGPIRDNTSIDDQQNDVVKMSVLERNFDEVKTNHEDRIRELEASVQKLLRGAVHADTSISLSAVPVGSIRRVNGQSSRSNRSENSLLSKLSEQFSSMRAKLSDRTQRLLQTETQLNETSSVLAETQDDLFETSEQLIVAEHEAALYKQENSILKNQLKDKTTRLDRTTEKLNISETKLRAMEIQLYALVRSEANLKEELGYYQYELNRTKALLDQLQMNFTQVERRLRKTKQTLKKTELELMECYTAKTQTFCGFEDDKLCGFTQENETDDFDWTRARVQTPSGGTGPTGDHTCGPRTIGHFMYIETSQMKPGLHAMLISVKYRGLSQQCAEFHYHMYGRHIGTLNVYTKTEGGDGLLSVWRTFGNQGDTWILARMAVPESLARIGYRIVFEGISGLGYQGDIAIDDISVTDGECPRDNRAVAVPIPVPTPSPTNQTAEEDADVELARLRKLRKIRKLFKTNSRGQRALRTP